MTPTRRVLSVSRPPSMATLENEFSRVGMMSRPAGCGGMMDVSSQVAYGNMYEKGADRGAHALRLASPYAEKAERGWAPKEPATTPNWSDSGAGTVSAGCIDNTYMPSPLKNKWGKQKGMSKREAVVLPHKQARPA